MAGAVRGEVAPWLQSAAVRADRDEDWAAIRAAADDWMRRDYGFWLDEWGYRGIPRGVLVEPFIGAGGRLPTDYKLYVFHGRVEAVQVHLDREHRHRWRLFDRAGRRLSDARGEADPPLPANLPDMIAGAEALGRGFDFVRIDFYDVHPVPRFGDHQPTASPTAKNW